MGQSHHRTSGGKAANAEAIWIYLDPQTATTAKVLNYERRSSSSNRDSAPRLACGLPRRRFRSLSDRSLIRGFLDLVYTENRGIAFGQLQQLGALGRWFFVSLAVAAAFAVIFYFFRTPRTDDRVLGACALLLAGIAGNLTDRVRFGYVIDFILLHAGSYHWPTFNVADASICLGALLLAYDLVFEGKKKKSVVGGQ